jgi:hypothetical protein
LYNRTKLPFCTPGGRFFASARAAIGVEGKPFSAFIYVCIIMNCFVLAIQRYPTDPVREQIIFYFNAVFTAVFLLEMLLKILFFGPVGYCLDPWNVFDAIVTVLTTTSMFIRSMKLVVLFRSFRIVKLVSLSRAASMNKEFSAETVLNPIMDLPRIMNVLNKSFNYVGYLYALLFIFNFVFAIVGREYLGNTIHIPVYKTFGLAMVTAFQLSTGEKWEELMAQAMLQGTDAYAAYFFAWLIISKWFIMSFVTAMVIYFVDQDGRDYLAFVARGTTISVFKMEAALRRIHTRIQFSKFKVRTDPDGKGEKGKVALLEEEQEPKVPSCLTKFIKTQNSLGIFPENNCFRIICNWLVETPVFQNLLLLMILASAGCMTVQLDYDAKNRPLPADVEYAFGQLEILVTGLFVLELVLYTIGSGLLLTRKAYLKGGASNIVDFIITMCSVANVLLDVFRASGGGNLTQAVKVLRVLRVFRIIRLATRSKVTRLILGSLWTSWSGVGWVIGLVSVIVVVFAVAGIQLFAGAFHYCPDPGFPAGGYFNKAYPGFPNGCNSSLVIPPLHYDDFPDALISSIVTFSLDGYNEPMYQAMNSFGIGRQPLNAEGTTVNIMWSLYYIMFICVTIVVSPLFVGVLYGTFLYSVYVDGDLRKRVASIKDAEWAIYRMKLRFIKPFRDPSRPVNFRKYFYDLVYNPNYGYAVTFFVLLHVCIRFGWAFDTIRAYFQEGGGLSVIFSDWGNAFCFFCMVVYILDMLCIRAIALGFRGLFTTALDKIDFLVNVVLLAQYVLSILGIYETFPLVVLDIFEIILAFRIFRALDGLPRTKAFFGVVVKTLQGVVSIAILLVCVMYIYAIFGLILFSKYKMDTGDALSTKHLTFDSVSNVMLILAGVGTGDNWKVPMLAMAKSVPQHIEGLVYLYFCTFLILFKFVFMNMFLLIVLQKFEIHNEDKTGLAMGQVREFRRAWHIFDEYGKGKIVLKHLPLLLRRLGEPLGTSSRLPMVDAERKAQKIYYLMTLFRIKWESEDPKKRKKKDKWCTCLKKKEDMVERLADEAGRVLTLEDLAWIETPRDIMAPDKRNQKVLFTDVIIASHFIAIFKTVLPDEAQYMQRRKQAQEYVKLLKEGVLGLVNRSRFGGEGPEAQALVYLTTTQRHHPSAYRMRIPEVLHVAYELWKDRVDEKGYDAVLHLECKHILGSLEEELRNSRQQMKLFDTVSKESTEDQALYAKDHDELRKMAEALDKTQRRVQDIRKHYVDVIWQRDSIQIVQQVRVPQSSINAVALDANSELLYIGDSDGVVRIFRKKSLLDESAASDETLTPLQKKNRFKFVVVQEIQTGTPVLCISVMADGRRFLAAGKDNTIRCWTKDVTVNKPGKEGGAEAKGPKAKGRKIYSPENFQAMEGHKGEIYAMEPYLSNYLFSAGQDGFLRMWQARGHAISHKLLTPRVGLT